MYIYIYIYIYELYIKENSFLKTRLLGSKAR